MRLVSLGVMFADSIPIDQVVKKIEEHFTTYLPGYRMYYPPNSNHVLLYWDKLTVGDNLDMNQKIIDIEDSIPNCRVFSNELGEKPTTWKKWGPTIIGIVGGGIIGVITAIFFKN
jgi:hypothetical protein